MTQADVLYIADAAPRLGKTETALRAMCQRGSKNMPKPIKIGGKWAWRRAEFNRWVKQAGKDCDPHD